MVKCIIWYYFGIGILLFKVILEFWIVWIFGLSCEIIYGCWRNVRDVYVFGGCVSDVLYWFVLFIIFGKVYVVLN